MKKILIILFIVVLSSCDKSDDTVFMDPISDTFYLYSILWGDDLFHPTICQEGINMSFTNKNTGTYTLYEEGSSRQCQKSGTGNLQWEKSGNKYRVSSSIPFLDGAGIQIKTANAVLDGRDLVLSFSAEGSDFEVVYRKN